MKTYCGENLEKAFPIGHDVMKFKAQNVKLHGKKFGPAAAPRGNAVALNRRPQRALCIGRQLSYFGNAAFPHCGATAVPKFSDSNCP